MKILYDHQIFSYQKFGGISRYFYELISNNVKYDDIVLGLKYSDNDYLKKSDLFKLKDLKFFNKFNNKIIKFIIIYYLNKNISIKFLKEQNFDIFHPTFYDSYFLNYLKNKPLILTIHDMIPEIFSEEYNRKGLYFFLISKNWINAKRKLAKKTKLIIAVSKNTKKDIIKFYDIDPEKIYVIYNASSLILHNESLNFKIPEKYLLYVGNRNSYKNFFRFVEAVSFIMRSDKNINIICIGGEKFNKNEINFFRNLNIENKIYQYEITDRILNCFYKKALAFVFPSLYEGFGIPILESFSCKCPVIISNASCFPEIAEEAAEYFNPLDVKSIKKAIESVIYDNNKKNYLIKKGNERLKEFSWIKTIKQTREIYNKIIYNKF